MYVLSLVIYPWSQLSSLSLDRDHEPISQCGANFAVLQSMASEEALAKGPLQVLQGGRCDRRGISSPTESHYRSRHCT